MKMFNLGKIVCIALGLFGLIFSQAYAFDLLCDNMTVNGWMVIGSSPDENVMADSCAIIVAEKPINNYNYARIHSAGHLSFFNPPDTDWPITNAAKIMATDEGLVFGNNDYPEILIDKDNGNFVLSTDIELVGKSNEIKAESNLNIKSSGDICIGNCD